MLHDPPLIVVLFADFIDYIQVNLWYNYDSEVQERTP